MNYRRAEEEERIAAVQLESDIFHNEQGIPVDTDFLKRNPVFWVAEENGVMIGTVASWQIHGETHWGRFAVKPAYRGKGVGFALARFCFEDLFSQGTEVIYMEARDATVKIFTSMGGAITGEPVMFFGRSETPLTIKREDFYRSLLGEK